MSLTTIQMGQLKALVRFAAVPGKDHRFYLHGVCFEPQGYAVATDGHTLLAVRIPAFSSVHPVPFIVPIAVIKASMAMNKKASSLVVTPCELGGISFTPIDGRFPPWQQLLAVSEAPNKDAVYDPDYLARIKAAALDMGYSREGAASLPLLSLGQDKAAVVAMGRGPALAMVMPIRADAPDPTYAASFVKPLPPEGA
jgi:hypothetical protein